MFDNEGMPAWMETLLEWGMLILLVCTVAVCAVVIATAGGCVPYDTPAERAARATERARAYLLDLGVRDASVSCVSNDSDQDGYVSCTVKSGGGDGFTQLECTYRTYDVGCKPWNPPPVRHH